MLIDSEDPPAVPLWVDGHAFLTMAPDFMDVCCPADGRVLRRTPLCDGEIAGKVVDVGLKASEVWRALSAAERNDLFLRLAESLVQYADHFRRLIVDETGQSEVEAGAEIDAALVVLRAPDEAILSEETVVVVVFGRANAPLLDPLRMIVPALAAGASIVVKPDPRTPSVLVALGELAARCGFPPGVFNVVHGDDELVAGFRELRDVRLQII